MRSTRHPVRLIPLAFLLAVVVGTGLLMLPMARVGDGAAPPLTAVFTAVSSVCVTGLITVDTPSYWTPFGEGVIAALIQIGGMGIMTLASLVGLLVMGRLRLRNRLMAQTETKNLSLGGIRNVVARIVIFSMVIETVLAVVLAARYRLAYDYDVSTAIWHGVFHSIASFNNAGFALHKDSLERFVADAWITMPIGVAVILGGLGFPVLFELARTQLRPSKWTLHSKLTLLGSGIFLSVGFVGYVAFEWSNPKTLGPLAFFDRVQAAFFAGIMPRTAGFNAITIKELNPETLAVTDVLMVIGGGSGGTAGGIKVTTFLVLAFVVLAEIRGDSDVSAFIEG